MPCCKATLSACAFGSTSSHAAANMHAAQELTQQATSADIHQIHTGLHSFTGQKSLSSLDDKLIVMCTHRY